MFRISLGITLGMALGCAPVLAGESIDDLVAAALATHPELRALQAERDVADADLKSASLRPNPQVESEVGYKRAESGEETEDGYVVGIGLAQTFERGGKRAARTAVATADQQLADRHQDVFRRQLEADVRGLAWSYAIASADTLAADEVSRRSQALIDMLKQRPAAGAAVFLELRVIEANLLEFQAAARERAAQRDEARIALNALLNRDPDSPLELMSALGAPALPADTNSLVAQLSSDPRLRVREAERTRADAEGLASAADSKADITAGPFFSHEDAGEQESVIGMTLELELPRADRKRANTAATSARRAQAQALVEAESRRLESDLVRALAAYARAKADLDWVTAQRVEELHAAADLAERQYRLGAINVQLFLDLQRESLNVQRLRHDALLRAWQRALDVFLLTGQNPKVQS